MSKNASSTDKFDKADVSKYGILPFSAHHSSAYYLLTSRSYSLSNLLPTITNGNLCGCPGAACSKNPDFHLWIWSNDAWLVISKQITQQSAPR